MFPHPQSLHHLNPLRLSPKYIKEQWGEDADAVADVDVEDVNVEDADAMKEWGSNQLHQKTFPKRGGSLLEAEGNPPPPIPSPGGGGVGGRRG